MEASNKFIISIVIIILLGLGIYWLTKDLEVVKEVPENTNTEEPELVTYKTSEYSPEFTYPASWGQVSILPSNKICPEEDTYRTQDSLSVFDQEFSFNERKLPGSESMIRTGIRTRALNPKELNDCGDKFLFEIGTKKLNPQILSSIMLQPIALPAGLWGFYNDRASRLNTENREQYTFFMIDSLGRLFVVQAYMSFIPFFGSPELAELDGDFKGDMYRYVKEGKTAVAIRDHLGQFRKMAESLKWNGE